MLIISQDNTVVTTMEHGPVAIESEDDSPVLLQNTYDGNFLFLGKFSDIDRAKEIMCLMVAAYERGNSSYKVPPDEFTEEVCVIFVDENNFLNVTRTGRVISVAVQDELLHGCFCQFEGCKNLGGCISSLSQLSAKNRSGNGTD